MTAAVPLKIKILVLGPPKSGKTTVSNYLADSNDISLNTNRPTRGVRIVEFESNDLELNGERVEAEVELWDCSGDKQYERCWPAIRRNTDGVIFVCKSDQDNGSALLPWYQVVLLLIALIKKKQKQLIPLKYELKSIANMSSNMSSKALRLIDRFF
ncbi:hypothetical protein X798_04438 [Onchocerca flexuosa]|uniref:Miro-like protein n=1 Tax=Onchocerca flexuosa TaxID=387005 RepID=A0A238BUC4_9BILA|nr:hypothetical protein X798_04438 [Onchocerca flexuosa]